MIALNIEPQNNITPIELSAQRVTIYHNNRYSLFFYLPTIKPMSRLVNELNT